MRNEMEIAAVTHVAVVDEHVRCSSSSTWNVNVKNGPGVVYSLNELHRRTVRQLTAARASECASHCTCGGSFRGIRGVRKKCNLVQSRLVTILRLNGRGGGARELSPAK